MTCTDIETAIAMFDGTIPATSAADLMTSKAEFAWEY
jgi:hypothetical protein